MPPPRIPMQNLVEKQLPRMPPMLVQHAPNPNDRQPQLAYNTKPVNFQALSVNIDEINDMHLCSRRELHNPPPPTISKHLNIWRKKIKMTNRRKKKMLQNQD